MARRRTTTVWFFAMSTLALATGACSLLFSTSNDQCSSDGDCQTRGAGFASMRCASNSVCVASDLVGGEGGTADSGPDPFACASLPTPTPDPSKQVEMTMRYTDYSTGAPPINMLARLCSSTDSNCENARSTLEGAGPGDAGPEGGIGWVVVPADGVLKAKVEYGFEGFFQAKAPQYPPTYRGTAPPLRNPKNEFEQLLLRLSEIKFLSSESTGKTYESTTHGLVFVFARDCDQKPLASVSFTTSAVEPIMQLFYVINATPSITDTKTDSLGRGGFMNVPPGVHTFTAWLGEGENKKRIGATRVIVRPGANTTIVVSPTK